jgi:hypothetical protein
MTTFLIDYGKEGKLFVFLYNQGNNYFMDKKIKEKGVAFKQSYFVQEFGKHGMKMYSDPLLESWRLNKDYINYSWPQDILIFSK